MKLYLVDCNELLVNAWKKTFENFPEVSILKGNLLDSARHCIVSPANSYGFMDGGIDAEYRTYFGVQIEQDVQVAISRRSEGLLPVGTGIVVRTGHQLIPYLIVVPTMAMPEMVESRNCYRAMRAVLRILTNYPEIGNEVYCPGLGTGVGYVPLEIAAAEMAKAYEDWKQSNLDGSTVGVIL